MDIEGYLAIIGIAVFINPSVLNFRLQVERYGDLIYGYIISQKFVNAGHNLRCGAGVFFY